MDGKKKKSKIVIVLIAITLIAVSAIAIRIISQARNERQKAVREEQIRNYIEAGEYDEAAALLKNEDGSYFDEDKYKEANYLWGMSLIDAGEYTKALDKLIDCDHYGDADESIKKIYYALANKELGEEHYSAAITYFDKIKGFRDSDILLQNAVLIYGQYLLDNQSYLALEKLYSDHGMDAAELIEESKNKENNTTSYEDGLYFMSEGYLPQAIECFEKCQKDYEDVPELLELCREFRRYCVVWKCIGYTITTSKGVNDLSDAKIEVYDRPLGIAINPKTRECELRGTVAGFPLPLDGNKGTKVIDSLQGDRTSTYTFDLETGIYSLNIEEHEKTDESSYSEYHYQMTDTQVFASKEEIEEVKKNSGFDGWIRPSESKTVNGSAKCSICGGPFVCNICGSKNAPYCYRASFRADHSQRHFCQEHWAELMSNSVYDSVNDIYWDFYNWDPESGYDYQIYGDN